MRAGHLAAWQTAAVREPGDRRRTPVALAAAFDANWVEFERVLGAERGTAHAREEHRLRVRAASASSPTSRCGTR